MRYTKFNTHIFAGVPKKSSFWLIFKEVFWYYFIIIFKLYRSKNGFENIILGTYKIKVAQKWIKKCDFGEL